MAIQGMISSNMFQEQYSGLISEPINNGYGGFSTAAKLVMSINRIKNIPNKDKLSKIQSIGNSLYMVGFMLSLLPIVIAKPRFSNMVISGAQTWLNVLDGGSSFKVAAIKILRAIFIKMQTNFILAALLLPISGLISIILLIVGEAIGDISDMDKSAVLFIAPITTTEVIQRYIRSIRLISMRIGKQFPMITKIFSFILNIFNKLHNAYKNIKLKITKSIKSSQEDETKMESMGVGKVLGSAFFVGVIVMLLKKTRIGGFFALFVTMILALSKRAKMYVMKIPFLYSIFKIFKTSGAALARKFNLPELFAKFAEWAKNLKIVQSLYSTFSNK